MNDELGWLSYRRRPIFIHNSSFIIHRSFSSFVLRPSLLYSLR